MCVGGRHSPKGQGIAVFVIEFTRPGTDYPLERKVVDVETIEEARMEAAIRDAGAASDTDPATAYRILGTAGSVIYRYPEED